MMMEIKGILDIDSIATAEHISESAINHIVILTKSGYEPLDEIIKDFYDEPVKITIETINS